MRNQTALSFIALIALLLPSCTDTGSWKMKQARIMTQWASRVDPGNPLPEYPRPQLTRPDWLNLNGLWQYEPGKAGDSVPAGRKLSDLILVPFPVESAISGVMKHYDRLWYRRLFTVPPAWKGKRVILRFGAVDWESEVYVNGSSCGIHKGGYDPFSLDITPCLKEAGLQELIVRVYDPTDNYGQPRGKQTLYPGGIMYTCSTGIWQTVWLEPVPGIGIDNLKIIPDIDHSTLRLTVFTAGPSDGVSVAVKVKAAGSQVAEIGRAHV
jgi:beta-galactosidase/beta-glucuronidase